MKKDLKICKLIKFVVDSEICLSRPAEDEQTTLRNVPRAFRSEEQQPVLWLSFAGAKTNVRIGTGTWAGMMPAC
jgi:hypothetical protein